MEFSLLILIIVLALLFDYIHGFHDAAHKIESKTATHLAIRILSTKKRVKDLIRFPAG